MPRAASFSDNECEILQSGQKVIHMLTQLMSNSISPMHARLAKNLHDNSCAVSFSHLLCMESRPRNDSSVSLYSVSWALDLRLLGPYMFIYKLYIYITHGEYYIHDRSRKCIYIYFHTRFIVRKITVEEIYFQSDFFYSAKFQFHFCWQNTEDNKRHSQTNEQKARCWTKEWC